MRSKIVALSVIGIAVAAIAGSCRSEQELKYQQYYAAGRRLYETHCQNCHAQDGKGLGTLFPPLTDTVLLRAKRSDLACIAKQGLTGRISVGGRPFEGEMPGNPALTAIDLAEIVTYITNSFGNAQGIYDVSEAEKDCVN